MRLLYVSGLYMPASGGAEWSAYTLLRYLAKQGHTISVVTGHRDDAEVHSDERDKEVGIEVTRIEGISSLPSALWCLRAEYPAIKAIITQNLWCDQAILWGRQAGIPVIYFLRSPSGGLDVSVGGPYECDYVVGNSPATVAYLAERWGRRDARLVPPMVEVSWYRALANSLEYITMVNPIVTKGGAIFKEIAARMPARRFIAVQGWGHLRKEGRWDLTKLRELARGYGEDVLVPEEADLTGLPNVVIHPTVEDMRLIYGQTRLLLIPSIVPEAAPRVALEAMINGIPVVASDTGGTAQLVGDGGVVISDYLSIDRWTEAINRFDDPEYYSTLSRRARMRAAQQDNAAKAKPLLEILGAIEAAHGG